MFRCDGRWSTGHGLPPLGCDYGTQMVCLAAWLSHRHCSFAGTGSLKPIGLEMWTCAYPVKNVSAGWSIGMIWLKDRRKLTKAFQKVFDLKRIQ
jgi:hypothetical protein